MTRLGASTCDMAQAGYQMTLTVEQVGGGPSPLPRSAATVPA